MARRRRSSDGDGSLWLVALALLLLSLYGVVTAVEAVTLAPMDAGLRLWTVAILGAATCVTFRGTGLIRLPAGLRGPQGARRADARRDVSLGEFLLMTPTQFELAVAEVLGRHGYRLRHTGGPGDLTADLLGTDAEGRVVAVQCKRYQIGNNIGSPDLQQFIGMATVHHGAATGVYVTTADYTQAARRLAAQHGIRLIAGEDLVALARAG